MLSLNGTWEMRAEDETDFHPALVPGTMYADLLRDGRIPDPCAGENEAAARELSAKDYYYKRTFEMPSSGSGTAGESRISRQILVCEGIDTLADIRLNGKRVGKCDNMHRIWRFDVTDYLITGENEIEVRLHAPLRFVRRMNERRPIWGVDTTVPGYQYIRKAHSQFGWDWGPQLPDAGIWRDIYLEEVGAGRIDSALIRQEPGGGGKRIAVEVRGEFQSIPAELQGEVSAEFLPEAELECRILDPDGKEIFSRTKRAAGQQVFIVPIESPRLWWPSGYGEQPLYCAELRMYVSGAAVSMKSVRFGLRDVTVVRRADRFGESFTFCVNGSEIFAKGANYIPEDAILGRRSRERTEKLLRDCVRSNFNCIRVWGGGHYPDDWFYDLCDELGLLVWQDFMFACAVYDLTNELAKNLRAEAADNIRRLRNHPSLALWCGNNEMESAWTHWGIPNDERLRADYLSMFERVIPSVLAKEDPDRFYWPSSPSSGGGFVEPSAEHKGDAHYWDVWHGGKPFEDVESKYFRYFSEYGFEALPDLRTLRAVMEERDLNLSGPVMESHQKCAGGNQKLMSYLLKYYLCPKDFPALIYATQSLQGDFLEMAIRHLRSHRDRCAGSTYWQVNDCWATVSWATIDFFGRWKGAQYIVKRAYAPEIVYAEPLADEEGFGVYVSFDVLPGSATEYLVRARVTDQEAGVVLEREEAVSCKPLGSLCAMRIPAEAARGRYLHYELVKDGAVVDSGNRLLCPPKAFAFRDPQLQAEILAEEGSEPLRVRVAAKEFARRVSIEFPETDLLLADNFFDLLPGESRSVAVLEVRSADAKDLPAAALADRLGKELRVVSNFDIA